MFLKEEIEAAQKLFLAIHKHRYDFLFQSASNSDEWKTVIKPDGVSYKNYTLLDYQIIDIIFGGNTVIKTGFRSIKDIEYLSVRFGKFTRYFALDIDSDKNEYYNLYTISKILEITRHLGKPIFMTSSYTNGWHLRWYFTEEIKTYNLAVYLRDLFMKNGLTIQDGKLEIYPNVKSEPKTLYQGLRLPCQRGSTLLSLEDGRKIARWDEGIELYLIHWADEVNKNLIDSKAISSVLSNDFKNPTSINWKQEYLELKEKGLTSSSQTNYALGRIAQGYRVFEGISDVDELTKILCQWIDEKHNGLSEEYGKSPELAYGWCKRWAICAIKKRKPLNKLVNKPLKNNSKRALSAQYDHQLEKAFKDGFITKEMSSRKIEQITGISKSVVQRKLNTLQIQYPVP